MTQSHVNPVTLRTEEAADYLGLAVSTLNKWRCHRNGGPAYLKLGRCVRYRLCDLDQYLTDTLVRAPSSTI